MQPEDFIEDGGSEPTSRSSGLFLETRREPPPLHILSLEKKANTLMTLFLLTHSLLLRTITTIS